MNKIISQNIGLPESTARFVVGMILIVAVYQPGVSPLVALVALYPVFTAMMQWDPAYALLAALKPAKSQSPKHASTPTRQATA